MPLTKRTRGKFETWIKSILFPILAVLNSSLWTNSPVKGCIFGNSRKICAWPEGRRLAGLLLLRSTIGKIVDLCLWAQYWYSSRHTTENWHLWATVVVVSGETERRVEPRPRTLAWLPCLQQDYDQIQSGHLRIISFTTDLSNLKYFLGMLSCSQSHLSGVACWDEVSISLWALRPYWLLFWALPPYWLLPIAQSRPPA